MKVLIVIDMQNDFITGPLGTPEAANIVPLVKAKIEEYREGGNWVFFTRDNHLEADYTFFKKTIEQQRIEPHCIFKTKGINIVPELDNENNRVLTKSDFAISSEQWLEILERARYKDPRKFEIEICGVCTDICVVSNALMLRKAFPDVEIKLDAQCCAGTTPEAHQAALTVMKSCLIDVYNEEPAAQPEDEDNVDNILQELNRMDKLVAFIESKGMEGMQTFDIHNNVGDEMTNIYDEDGIQIDICYEFNYLEIFGLTEAEKEFLSSEGYLDL